MNATDLVALTQGRIPGYSTAEYLRELNANYDDELYNAAKRMENSFFQDTVILTVDTAQSEFELMFNQDNSLSAPVGLDFSGEIIRLRVKGPSSNKFVPGIPLGINASKWLSLASTYPPADQVMGPYYYNLYDQATLRFPTPIAVNSELEITYIYTLLPLKILSAGTVSSVGTAVTGSGTAFTTIVPPDYLAMLPGTDPQLEIDAELQVNGLNYRINSITDDTHLTLIHAPAIDFSGVTYSLSNIPKFPADLHGILSIMAVANLMTSPEDDSQRYVIWANKAQKAQERFMDSITERQHQTNPRKKRFPLRPRF